MVLDFYDFEGDAGTLAILKIMLGFDDFQHDLGL